MAPVVLQTSTIPSLPTSEPLLEYKFLTNYLRCDQPTRFFHLVSLILLAVTAIFNSQTHAGSQNVEAQQCIFHLTLTLCVIHMEIYFNAVDEDSTFSFRFEYTIIILGLASFLWSSMLVHQLWKNFGRKSASSEETKSNSRLLLGYGIPGVLFIWAAVKPTSSIEMETFYSRIVTLALSLAIFIQMMNTFFFIDLLRKALRRIVWYSYDTSLQLKEILYRTVVFAMLFYILCLPWLIIVGCELLSFVSKSEEPKEIISSILRLFSAEGIFLSFIFIIYHKYAWADLIIKEEKSWEEVVVYEKVTPWEKSVE